MTLSRLFDFSSVRVLFLKLMVQGYYYSSKEFVLSSTTQYVQSGFNISLHWIDAKDCSIFLTEKFHFLKITFNVIVVGDISPSSR